MPERDYDNSNRLPLWAPKDQQRRAGYYTGYGDIGGRKIHDAVMIVSERDKGPYANLWWRTDQQADGEAMCTPIWNNDGKLGGKIDGWWVNVFKNETGPALTVTFKQMDGQQTSSASKTANNGVAYDDSEDLPF